MDLLVNVDLMWLISFLCTFLPLNAAILILFHIRIYILLMFQMIFFSFYQNFDVSFFLFLFYLQCLNYVRFVLKILENPNVIQC